MSIDADQAPYRTIVLAFASALVAGDFEHAYASLDAQARGEWSIHALRIRFVEMVSYFDAPPQHCEIIETLHDWPGKEIDDIAWVYVSVCSEGQSEAVAMIVCDQSGELLIREIQWGRP
jgi:hypothetical protein